MSEDSGVSRRHVLYLAGGIGVAGVAGVTLLGGGPPGDPGKTVSEYYAAVDNGSASDANALLHPSGPEEKLSASTAEQYGRASITLESVAVEEHGQESARADATVTIGLLGQNQTRSVEVELRRHGGEWLIWRGR